jgi:hypothetical protein
MADPHVAVSRGCSFDDLLTDPLEQFDLRSELLASIFAYAAAPEATAGTRPRRPGHAAYCAWLYAPGSTTGITAAPSP